MPFNSLLLTSLKYETHFTRSGVSVTYKAEGPEKALFFEIDDQTNKQSTFRKDLNIAGNICDFLVLYTTKEMLDNGEKVLCLVELKSGTPTEAVLQIKKHPF